VPVVISHHKVIGAKNYGRSDETLAYIQKNMAKQPICLDCYPYTAGSTVLSYSRAETSSRVIVTWSKPLPQYAGQDLDKIAKQMGVSEKEAVVKLLPAGAIYFRMDEGDVQKILQFAPTMIGSDGLPHDASPHPRLWSTFPRVLGHYRRSLKLFSLETAVHKMTGLTATNFGLTDRGVIKEGAFADLTLFDEATIDEVATYDNPIALAKGIHTVIVNGEVVWAQGKATSARPGRVLSRALTE
jgi:N-acyl-D-amino-acid deacylase